MEYLLTASQNAEADRYTQDKIGIPQLVLMERAALSVREEIVKLDPSGTFSILIYCGRGNNGADGLALGRLLAEDGRSVQIYLLSEGGQISAAAAKQLSILQALHIPVLSFPSEEKEMPENPARTIIVDALIGIGFHGKIKAPAAEAVSSIRKLSGKGAFVLAVDMPTGVNTDTGGADENAVRADLTVTFQYRKRGQVLYPGASYCGKTVTKSIGIVPPPEFSGKEKGDNLVFTMNKEDLSGLPPRPADGNKGTFGKVLLLAGSRGMAGASILAAAAALHTGAGMVRVITPESNRQILQARLPEAMVSCYPDDDPASISRDIEMYADWADSFAAGPGLGTGPAARTMLWTFMKAVSAGRGPRVLVLDADAVRLVAKDNELAEMLVDEKRNFIPVLTPHIGEFAALTGTDIPEIKKDPIRLGQGAADRFHSVLVLKDARTFVFAPEELKETSGECGTGGQRIFLNSLGNDGMATAGSGDVLTGIISGLAPRAGTALGAAVYGVLLHGASGDLAAGECGREGMTAVDIVHAVGPVLLSTHRKMGL